MCVFSTLSFSQEWITDEPPSNTWKDPIMGWTWHVAAIAVDWKSALVSCPAGTVLPDQATIRYAYKRLKKSNIAEYLKHYEVTTVWTTDEFDWRSAMAVNVCRGFSHNVWKLDFLGVLCVQK